VSFAFQGSGFAFQRTGFAFQQEADGQQPYPKPAGRPSKRKRRLEVEIDGQVFEVESIQQAQALLDRAREIAQAKALEIVSPLVEQRLRDKPPEGKPIRVPAPKVYTADAELQEIVIRARHSIAKVYRQAALDAEIRLRIQLQEIEDDDEDLLMLL
jgi:hypothetical protein